LRYHTKPSLQTPPGWVGWLARTAGGVRVNEKTAENPRSWPLVSGHLARSGRRFEGFSLFFQSGRAHSSCLIFASFLSMKSEKNINKIL